jgi:hypothetical protein
VRTLLRSRGSNYMSPTTPPESQIKEAQVEGEQAQPLQDEEIPV